MCVLLKSDVMLPVRQRPRYQRLLLAGGRGLVAVPLLAEALARPAYQPLLRALSRLTLLQCLDQWIAPKPRWLIRSGGGARLSAQPRLSYLPGMANDPSFGELHKSKAVQADLAAAIDADMVDQDTQRPPVSDAYAVDRLAAIEVSSFAQGMLAHPGITDGFKQAAVRTAILLTRSV